MDSSRRIHYGSIQIFDDVVPLELYRKLFIVAHRIPWQFGWNTPSNPNNRYWHFEVGGGGKKNFDDVSDIVAKHPIKTFGLYQDWLRESLVPKSSKILRFYLNAHTFGTDGWPHTDTDRCDELTTVLYLTQEWKPEWCGETVIFDGRGDIEAAVIPKPNRLLAFPSDRLHSPRPLSKVFEGLRIVLVVKMGPVDGDGAFFERRSMA
jgi:SM-20-related protein